MPKPMLGTLQFQAKARTNVALSTENCNDRQHRQQLQADKMKLDRLFRKTRSKEYMEAMKKLDAGGHVHNQDKVDAILDTIRNEFPEVKLAGILLGCVSVCHLGRPYEVHTLDITEGIIEHYKAGQTLPNGMEKARGIAMRGGYEFIEVYVDCCRAISAGGAVSVISC